MFYYLFLTAFTVSIDSFICGLSLSLSNYKKLWVIFGITFIVFVMCLFSNYLPCFFTSSSSIIPKLIGGVILVFVGLFNLYKREEAPKKANNIKLILLSGFAVGIDGAIANFSLALMGINYFYVPLFIAIMHGITISFGVLLSKLKVVANFRYVSIFSSILLIALGIFKCLSLLI